ncbi:hypothetical protein SLEP1_g54452 [Rubroshorea leprosula]|uniref:Uncharacterized protein n=1 Tax=Rubroshorea leprosula TaxID=152421 RepID=A0AAV5MCF0_9ROSI|nr:hypothetical protein SLEP1_g54452 [Rubroshorea leprosula]
MVYCPRKVLVVGTRVFPVISQSVVNLLQVWANHHPIMLIARVFFNELHYKFARWAALLLLSRSTVEVCHCRAGLFWCSELGRFVAAVLGCCSVAELNCFVAAVLGRFAATELGYSAAAELEHCFELYRCRAGLLYCCRAELPRFCRAGALF